MDQAEPTGEELFPAEETYVLASATSAVIPVTSNRTWKARNHDSWVKDFTPAGTNNGNIEVSLDVNTGAARTARKDEAERPDAAGSGSQDDGDES